MSLLEKFFQVENLEWKVLGDITTILRGRRLTRDLLSENERYPVFHGGLEPLGFYARKNRSADTVMVINVGASAGTVGYSDVDFWSSDGCYCIEHSEEILNKFFYYYLTSKQNYLKSKVRVAGIPTLDSNVIEKILVPIPPIYVQKEIVRILDTFTELTEELTDELTKELIARKKQYNYFREKLLTFGQGDVEWKSLKEVAEIGTGSRNTNEAVVGGKYPFFVRSQEPRAIDEYEFDETAIITAGDGVGVGKVFHYVCGKYALHQRAYRIVISDNSVNSRFIFHFIRNHFGKYLESASVHASVTSLRLPMFERYLIPIPSMNQQSRIATILDKFETLASSMSEGLLKEIELRNKQYEYYRDLMLTFPKPPST